MDWYPLWNSLRVAALSTVLVFFLGLFAAYYIAKLPHWGKALLDVVLTLPLVLPPTVVGYFLLLAVGPRRPLGIWLTKMGVQLVMHWPGAVLASTVVAFPLMYRTVRGALEAFDPNLKYLLAYYHTGVQKRHLCRRGIGIRAGAWRIWCNKYDRGLYSTAYGDHFDYSISALAYRG